MCIGWGSAGLGSCPCVEFRGFFPNHSATSSYQGMLFSWQRRECKGNPNLFQISARVTAAFQISARVTAANIPLLRASHTAKPRRKGPGYTLPLPRGPAKPWVYNIMTGAEELGLTVQSPTVLLGENTSGPQEGRDQAQAGHQEPRQLPICCFAPLYASAAVFPPFSVAPSLATSLCQGAFQTSGLPQASVPWRMHVYFPGLFEIQAVSRGQLGPGLRQWWCEVLRFWYVLEVRLASLMD